MSRPAMEDTELQETTQRTKPVEPQPGKRAGGTDSRPRPVTGNGADAVSVATAD